MSSIPPYLCNLATKTQEDLLQFLGADYTQCAMIQSHLHRFLSVLMSSSLTNTYTNKIDDFMVICDTYNNTPTAGFVRADATVGFEGEYYSFHWEIYANRVTTKVSSLKTTYDPIAAYDYAMSIIT